jgi:hypothetical protein
LYCADLCNGSETRVLVSFELRSSAVKETFLQEANKAFKQVRTQQQQQQQQYQAGNYDALGLGLVSQCVPAAVGATHKACRAAADNNTPCEPIIVSETPLLVLC